MPCPYDAGCMWCVGVICRTPDGGGIVKRAGARHAVPLRCGDMVCWGHMPHPDGGGIVKRVIMVIAYLIVPLRFWEKEWFLMVFAVCRSRGFWSRGIA